MIKLKNIEEFKKQNSKEIVRKYNIGYSTSDLSLQYQCSYSTIYQILHENNVEFRKPRLTKQEKNKLICDIIADILGEKENQELRSKTILEILIARRIKIANQYTSTAIGKLLRFDDRFDIKKNKTQRVYSLK